MKKVTFIWSIIFFLPTLFHQRSVVSWHIFTFTFSMSLNGVRKRKTLIFSWIFNYPIYFKRLSHNSNYYSYYPFSLQTLSRDNLPLLSFVCMRRYNASFITFRQGWCRKKGAINWLLFALQFISWRQRLAFPIYRMSFWCAQVLSFNFEWEWMTFWTRLSCPSSILKLGVSLSIGRTIQRLMC